MEDLQILPEKCFEMQKKKSAYNASLSVEKWSSAPYCLCTLLEWLLNKTQEPRIRQLMFEHSCILQSTSFKWLILPYYDLVLQFRTTTPIIGWTECNLFLNTYRFSNCSIFLVSFGFFWVFLMWHLQTYLWYLTFFLWNILLFLLMSKSAFIQNTVALWGNCSSTANPQTTTKIS